MFTIPREAGQWSDEIHVLDAVGRLVAVLDGDAGPSEMTFRRGGHDQAGRPAPSGMYFAVVGKEESRRAVKLVWLGR
jgi:hypothetical protein